MRGAEEKISPWYGVNLALLFPGVGHLRSHHFGRGLLWLSLGLLLLLLTVWSFLAAEGQVQVGAGCLGMGVVLWAFSIIDAYNCLRSPQNRSQHFRSFVSQASPVQGEEKDIWFPIFLSQLLPGLGQVWLGQWGSGALWLLLAFGGVTAIAIAPPFALGLGLLSGVAAGQVVGWSLKPGSRVGPQQQPHPGVTLRRGWGLVLLIAVARSLLLGAPLISQYWVEPFVVPSESMLPTLQVGDRILVAKSPARSPDYRPQLQEIVVFRSRLLEGLVADSPAETAAPPAETFPAETFPAETFFVKRVIGLPGDRLEVKHAQVWRNGEPLEEPYLAEAIAYELPAQTLPPDGFFMLGDNRNFSFDSHIWGPVSGSDIVGRAYRISWPPERNQSLIKRN